MGIKKDCEEDNTHRKQGTEDKPTGNIILPTMTQKRLAAPKTLIILFIILLFKWASRFPRTIIR